MESVANTVRPFELKAFELPHSNPDLPQRQNTWADDQETTSPPDTDQSLIDQFDDDFPDAHD